MNAEQWSALTGLSADPSTSPHPWQLELAGDPECRDRLIRIPTGFGKTLGVLAAWIWHRVERNDSSWPGRLIWCLPMRVLVEQTEAAVRQVLAGKDLLWDGASGHTGKVGVHILMGGVGNEDWHLHPEQPAVLIGTQDMLLSRALNRGYASPRARWPMEFGLLNQDCLWVMDEVQLMDVGLATSGQLQSFRNQDERACKALRPCRTWWMSATLQPEWLALSPETRELGAELKGTQLRVLQDDRIGKLWQGVRKPCELIKIADPTALAQRIAERHILAGNGRNGPTLVVVNTVKTALAIHALLTEHPDLTATELRLAHSRFRPAERAGWGDQFLNRASCAPGTNRIIVATQVIEAGVDISSGLLITELAPWASLVQRFGRAARWGGSAEVEVIDFQHVSDKTALPYSLVELEAARAALAQLDGVAPLQLDTFEETHPELLPRLYPYSPRHLLLRHELDELFDTTPDLSGADIDISRFIRSGEERDLQVFWSDLSGDDKPAPNLRPSRDALCKVPFLAAQEWLCGKETASTKAPRLRPGKRAWIWNYLDGQWQIAERNDLYPGQTVLVAAHCGGYLPNFGWLPDSRTPVDPVAPQDSDPEDLADASENDETLSATSRWQTIAVHGAQVGREAAAMASALGPDIARLIELAGRWHDVGKALKPFQASIDSPDRPQRDDLAKAPDRAWLRPASRLYPDPPRQPRRGFRHELASTLALFAVLIRHHPDHPALLGPWRAMLELAGIPACPATPSELPPNALEREILELSADQFDLITYLVCSHHGKVRMAWHASPADQQAADSVLRLRGVRDGEFLPATTVTAPDGLYAELPPSPLHLDPASAGLNPRTGRGWTERVLGLLQRHGPFTLAYLEALLRAADQRASRNPVADPLLEEDNANHGLEASNRELAQIAGGGTSTTASVCDSTSRGQLHGDGERASERATHQRNADAEDSSTRRIDTAFGRLSYNELAPLLAKRAGHLEADIADRVSADWPIDSSLLLRFHRQLCGDLVPAIAGKWRTTEVQVGAHLPPPAWQVGELMSTYLANLSERMKHADEWNSELLLELLVYAEGQLLHIHPFTDFNGRITRLFLFELLYRLNLPLVDTAAADEQERQAYFAALSAYDVGDPRPLAAVWRRRFEKEASA